MFRHIEKLVTERYRPVELAVTKLMTVIRPVNVFPAYAGKK